RSDPEKNGDSYPDQAITVQRSGANAITTCQRRKPFRYMGIPPLGTSQRTRTGPDAGPQEPKLTTPTPRGGGRTCRPGPPRPHGARPSPTSAGPGVPGAGRG